MVCSLIISFQPPTAITVIWVRAYLRMVVDFIIAQAVIAIIIFVEVIITIIIVTITFATFFTFIAFVKVIIIIA